jgi:hypothetical protein
VVADRARHDADAALAAADATGDALASAVFRLAAARLAAARLAAALGDPGAPTAAVAAEAALAELGMGAPGWRLVFDLALAPVTIQS